MGSLSMAVAAECRVPAGHALTVDRELFSRKIAAMIAAEPLIEVVREELTAVPAEPERIVVVASGPLTSDALADSIARLTGSDRLYFHDSISPIVEADSIDMSVAFAASRWDNSIDGTADYINCPFDKPQYERFLEALLAAEQHHSHEWDNPNFFEGCLPIEEIARRGKDTLRFGPMKPAGLTDPRTGRWPYACVQLRQESVRADSYNIVGFQNHLKYGDQKRILRLIPGLENAEILRYGQIHRNTYINGPALLAPTLQLRSHPHILFAGQISGVEGYVEAMSTGLMAGWNAARLAAGETPLEWPRESAHGSLAHYICSADPKDYQPANITFDLLPPLPPEEQGRGGRIARPAAPGSAPGAWPRWRRFSTPMPSWPPELPRPRWRRRRALPGVDAARQRLPTPSGATRRPAPARRVCRAGRRGAARARRDRQSDAAGVPGRPHGRRRRTPHRQPQALHAAYVL